MTYSVWVGLYEYPPVHWKDFERKEEAIREAKEYVEEHGGYAEVWDDERNECIYMCYDSYDVSPELYRQIIFSSVPRVVEEVLR